MPSGRTWLLPFALEDADEGEHRRPGAGDAPICARARPASGSRMAMPAYAPASILILIYEPAVALLGQASLIMSNLRTKRREDVGGG